MVELLKNIFTGDNQLKNQVLKKAKQELILLSGGH
jgi:hypothetical protein